MKYPFIMECSLYNWDFVLFGGGGRSHPMKLIGCSWLCAQDLLLSVLRDAVGGMQVDYMQGKSPIHYIIFQLSNKIWKIASLHDFFSFIFMELHLITHQKLSLVSCRKSEVQKNPNNPQIPSLYVSMCCRI